MYEKYDQYGCGGSRDYYDSYMNEQLLSAKKSFSRASLSLVFYLIVSNAAVLIGQLVMIALLGLEEANALFTENILITYLFNVVSQYVIAFPVLYLVLRPIKRVRCEGEKMTGKEFVLAFLISQAFMQAGSIIGEALNSAIGAFLGGEITNDVSDMIMDTPIWLVILVVVVIGPIFEELIFRKLLFDRLSRYGTKLTIVVTSIAFGLFHGNLYQLFYAAALGLVLGFIYAKTRNLIYPIAMHILINLFGTLPALLLDDTLNSIDTLLEALASGTEININDYVFDLLIFGAYSFISSSLVIAGIITLIICIRNKKIRVRETCEFKLPRDRALSTAVSNVGTIIFLIIIMLTVILNLLPAELIQ